MKTWTELEVATLKYYFGYVSNERLAELLPNKSLTAIHKKARKMGLKISDEIKFLNRSNAKRGEKCNFWNGGRSRTSRGYTLVFSPAHHRADSRGYVLEHILVFENATGISVPEGCCIHHLNGVKDDNRIENLCMMTHSAHTTMHHAGVKRTAETRHRISEGKKNHGT